VDELEERVLRLEIWKGENGAHGAEDRICSIEGRHETCMIERLPVRVDELEKTVGNPTRIVKIVKEAGFMTEADATKIASAAVDSAFDRIKNEKLTGIERLKAAAPIIVAAFALAGTIAAPFIARALYMPKP
jgi:hypothetical protein